MKTILITGINGFLGSHLAKRLCLNYNIIGLEYSLQNLFRLENIDFKIYDTKTDNWLNLFEENKIDIVIHTATFYGRNNEDIKQIAETNFMMPFRLLDIAIKNKVSLFINTDTVLERFVSTYALTKRQFQEWLYIRRLEIKVINMKAEHFYGLGASPSNFITSMLEKLKNNVTQIDLTLGEQQRNFINIDDVCSAYEIVIQQSGKIAKSYTDFNVGTNQLISIKELMLYLKEITGSKSKLNFGAIPYRENEMMSSKTDNSKLVKLGWKPRFNLKNGLIPLIKL
jgi:CDP-paratose synthetase